MAFLKYIGRYTKQLIRRIIFWSLIKMCFFADLSTHSRTLQTYSPQPTHIERQRLLRTTINQTLQEIFGPDFDLTTYDTGNQAVYSIVDHHDLLNHPLFIFPNITANFFRFLSKKIYNQSNQKTAIITLSTAGISVDHFGNHRGMRFAGSDLKTFTNKQRHLLTLCAPPYTTFDFNQQKHSPFLKKIDRQLNAIAKDSRIQSYRDQVTITNSILWKQLFAADIRDNVPELFHVPTETITSSLLQTYIRDTTNLFYKMLFDSGTRSDILDAFNGIIGCWDTKRQQGTHFFWAITPSGSSERLWLNTESAPVLINATGSVRIDLTPENIMLHLQQQKIYPGTFLMYSMIVFYCGIKPLTGGRSNRYLSDMKNAWMRCATAAEKVLIEQIPVNNPIQHPHGTQYALDILYAGGLTLPALKKIERARRSSVMLGRVVEWIRGK